MANDIVQVEYDSLQRIAQRFQKSSTGTRQASLRLQRQISSLKGGWQGRGSAAFFAEMENEVLPAMKRLEEALGEANRTVLQVSKDIRTAEEEAARAFGVGFMVGAPGLGGGGVIAPGIIGLPGSLWRTFLDDAEFKGKGSIWEFARSSHGSKRGFDPGLDLRYGVFDKSLVGNLEKDGYALGGYSLGGGLMVSKEGVDIGVAGELFVAKGKVDGVAGSDAFALTGGFGGKALHADGFAGVRVNRDGASIGATIGATLVSVEGEVGVNVAGANVSVIGEVGIKNELGFEIGTEKSKLKLPFITVGVGFGRAKRD